MAAESKNKKLRVKICLAMAVCLPVILGWGWDNHCQAGTPGNHQEGHNALAVADQGLTDFGLPPFLWANGMGLGASLMPGRITNVSEQGRKMESYYNVDGRGSISVGNGAWYC